VTAFAPHGDEIYLLTYKNAPRFKVIRTNLVHPNVANGQVIVPSGNGVIKQIAAAEDALYVKVLTGGVSALQRVPFSGRGAGHPRTIPLPLSGTLSVDSADARISGMLFQFTSWTQEPAIYTYDPRSGSSTNTGLQAHGPLDSPPDLVTEEVMAKSYDGTLIPLSILHRRAIKLDGSYPALLYGYGAYGIALEHAYSPDKIAWVEEGGVYAEAQVRGGGAYGEQWHRAGMQLTKHNTWQDFIACAQYLIDNGYTSSARLAGGGGSAGGITIGRAITERPDLFAVAFYISGIADALRMEREPEGPANIPEFGSTSSPEGFKGLYAMSPYANVHEKTAYPAVMVLTGMNDPRVPFWQAAKLAARLQAATTSGKPVLLRADYSGGHGTNGSNRRQVAEFWGDMESFALWQLGVPGFQPAR
jgi:prolyl oligopeptidase